ncbi:MAG: type VI secretion system tube protein Hcp [Candidatus Heimdallarchaeota archaeon]|nr:type VI secretion system tube protein Hcp [Candidatus Heimdallarchaeota archaeon]
MTNKNVKYKYGLILLVPLVLSMLFMGINNYTSATSDDGLDLNQSELGIILNAGIHLRLQIDGSDIEGESTITSMDREGTIEVWSYRYELSTPRQEASGALAGRRQHSPIVITKRVDKSSPLLFKALAMNEPVTSAEFRFFRPDRTGSGAEEHYLTVLIENGYVALFRTFTLSDIGGGNVQVMEEVSFVFQDITITYEPTGATHMDSWRGEA